MWFRSDRNPQLSRAHSSLESPLTTCTLFSFAAPTAAPSLKAPKFPVLWLCILPEIPGTQKPQFNPASLRWCCQQAAFTCKYLLGGAINPRAHPGMWFPEVQHTHSCSTIPVEKSALGLLPSLFCSIHLWAKLCRAGGRGVGDKGRVWGVGCSTPGMLRGLTKPDMRFARWFYAGL